MLQTPEGSERMAAHADNCVQSGLLPGDREAMQSAIMQHLLRGQGECFLSEGSIAEIFEQFGISYGKEVPLQEDSEGLGSGRYS